MFDLLIRDGQVIDGTGRARRAADVAVTGGRIVEIGPRLSGSARRTIDASGRVVSPGFIDVHTHLDAQAFWDSSLSPSPLNGVTTVVGGNCGFSIAPLTGEAASYLLPMLARVEGMPLETLRIGVPWDWSSTEDYLDRLDGSLAVNAAFMVGHSAMRRVVMGEDANRRLAREDELEAMCDLLRAGLEAGGIGFSSTWNAGHQDADGNPVPSRFADADELIALAGVCAGFDGTSLEFIPQSAPGDPFSLADLEVMTAMSRAARSPLNWNLLRVSDATVDLVQARLAAADFAAARGGRIVALVLPEHFAGRLSFFTGFLIDSFPGWQKPMALPLPEKIALLSDREARGKLYDLSAQEHDRAQYAQWHSHRILETFTAETKQYEGRIVEDIAREQGKQPFDALVDIALTDGLRTYFGEVPQAETDADWRLRADVCSDRFRALVGGSDAGAHVDMIATHNYCTNLLANFVRIHGVMDLESAVALLTGAPAELYGFRDRGLLQPGKAADIVVFDEDAIGSTPIATRFDLPGDVGRLYSEGTGIDHVIVNGEEIVADGSLSERRPGRILRSGRDTSNTPMERR